MPEDDSRPLVKREESKDDAPTVEIRALVMGEIVYEAVPTVSITRSDEDMDEAGDDVDIPEDMYGAAMFTIIYDLYEYISGVDHDALSLFLNLLRICFIVCVLIATYFFQVGILYWIYTFVVLPTVHEAESIYQAYHAEVFNEAGEINDDLWASWPQNKKDQLCSVAFSSSLFMYAILCLWTSCMVIEMRKTERLWRDVMGIEHTDAILEMIDAEEGDGRVRIKKLTPLVRRVVYVVIIIPKLVIGVGLLLMGLTWLTATDGFSDLILNAVALAFVVNIDNLLYEALLPKSVCETIQNTKFWTRAKVHTKESHEKAIYDGFKRSICWFLFVHIGVYLFMTYGQLIPVIGVFTRYSHDADCPSHQIKISERVCQFGENCFPYGGRT